jgi:hypothetical protein
MNKKLYAQIITLTTALQNCDKSGNEEWGTVHSEALDYIENNILPHGSGIDSGCTIDRDSTENKLVINSSFHLMDENGYYDGWMDFKVIITPSLQFGACVNVKGRFSDQNYKYDGHRDYLQEQFDYCLNCEFDGTELNG